MQRIWDWLLNLQRVKLAGGEMTVRLTLTRNDPSMEPYVQSVAVIAR